MHKLLPNLLSCSFPCIRSCRDLGRAEPLGSCRLCSPHLRTEPGRGQMPPGWSFPRYPSKAGTAPPAKSSSLQSAACAQQHCPPCPLELGDTTRMEEEKCHCFHFYIWETGYECKTGLQSNFFIILSCLKSFKNNFLGVIFVRGYRGSLWKSQRPRAVYKASILTL